MSSKNICLINFKTFYYQKGMNTNNYQEKRRKCMKRQVCTFLEYSIDML